MKHIDLKIVSIIVVLSIVVSLALIHYFNTYSQKTLQKITEIKILNNELLKEKKAYELAKIILSKCEKVSLRYIEEKYGIKIPPPSITEFKRRFEKDKFDSPLVGYSWCYKLDSKTGKVVGPYKGTPRIGNKVLIITHLFTSNGKYIATVIRESTVTKKEVYAWKEVKGERIPLYKFSDSWKAIGWLKMEVKP